ncbi:MAG: lysozyme [Solirubrobacteraceae bacterium]
MKLSPAGEALIKGFENCKFVSYPDSKGLWTIGVGHTGFYSPGVPVGPGQTCTDEQAELWFIGDTSKAVADVNLFLSVSVNQNQFDALVSFTYNVGGQALEHSTLIRDINEGDPNDAANEFLKWDHCAGKELAGLKRRRKAERAYFLQAA